jgi:predicted Zn-dependent protease
MGVKKTQVFLIFSALVLFVLLFIAPKTMPNKAKGEADKMLSFGNANIDVFVNMAQKALSPMQKKQSDSLVSQKAFDSLVPFWDKLKRPDLASFYLEQTAKRVNSPASWFNAGNRYYYAVQFCEDKSEVPLLYQCAMRCMSKTLALNPKNSDAKILLASCYVEGTQSPMDGITLLKEVEKNDSNNVKLQLAFAFFSVRSGQLDKAIVRFKKVLRVDSNYIEAYLHLADAYERQGITVKTIEMLERYSAKTPDITAKMEIDKYIEQLKNNNNK